MTSMDSAAKQILVVDDLPENAAILSRFLAPMGYQVSAVHDGVSALEFVGNTPPDVILLDLAMPGMDGFQVCQCLKQSPETRHIPVIIITGLSDREANIHAIEAGADDFVVKPFDRVLLEARIRSSLKTKVLQDQLLAYQHELEERVRERTRQLERTQQVAVFSLAKLAESRDNETGDHLDRIRAYARELTLELLARGIFPETINPGFVAAIYESSPLHDIGKVGIPDQILLKPGKLTPQEFELMKNHTLIGGDTLRAADREAGQNSFLAMGRDIAYYHHEKYDGSGYPFGLSGEEIPLAARIVALADVYDALSSKRPYKEPFSHEKSCAIILESGDRHFDPRVVEAFEARENQFASIRGEFQGKGATTALQETLAKLESAQPVCA